MRNNIGILIFIFLAFSSCKKEDPKHEPSKTALLTSGPWVMVDYKLNNIRFYGVLTDCQKDNRRIFRTDGTYMLDEGPSKCDANDPQVIQEGAYHLKNDETEIEWRGKTHSIVSISSTDLALTFRDHSDVYELYFRHP